MLSKCACTAYVRGVQSAERAGEFHVASGFGFRVYSRSPPKSGLRFFVGATVVCSCKRHSSLCFDLLRASMKTFAKERFNFAQVLRLTKVGKDCWPANAFTWWMFALFERHLNAPIFGIDGWLRVWRKEIQNSCRDWSKVLQVRVSFLDFSIPTRRCFLIPSNWWLAALSTKKCRQKVFNGWALRLCRGDWHSKVWQKLHYL